MMKITHFSYQAKTKQVVHRLTWVFALLFVLGSNAQTKTAIASAAWNSAATWSPSGVPGSSDTVLIPSGVNVTPSTSNATVASLTVYGTVDFGAKNIEVKGNLIIGNGTDPASMISASTSSTGFVISGSGSLTVNAFGSLTANSNFTVPGDTSISGTVTIPSIGSNRTGTYTGNFVINAGGIWNDDSTKARTDTFAGTFVNNGTYNIPSVGVKSSVNGMVNNGVLNIAAASLAPELTATTVGNVVNYTGAGAQTVKAAAYANLGLSGTGAKTIIAGTAISGNLTIAGTAIANITTGGIIPVGSLTLGTNVQAGGTSYGGASSGAVNVDAVYFGATTAGNYIDVLVLGTDSFKAGSAAVVYSKGNQVFVSNVKTNTIVAVYSLTGALVKTLETSSDVSFDLNPGVYVVKAKSAEGEKSVKVLVK